MTTVLYILLALFVFGLLIMIHELGHFLVARAFRVGIHEFSIGMGPKIFSKKSEKSGIEYSLRALPVGGYVSMVGEEEESDNPDAFTNKPVWQRILVILAGPMMNILLGFLLTLVLVLSSGPLASNTVGQFLDDAQSPAYGLEIGDTVVKVNRTRVHTGNEVMYEILNSGYAPVDLTVRRGGETIVLDDVVFPGLETEGVHFGQPDFRVYAEKTTFASLMKHTWFRSVSTVKMIFDQLHDLLRGRYGLNAVSGPVGITEEIGKAAKTGMTTLLYLVTVITINLGVFNLLPIPALDGGRLLFLVAEGIARRPLNRKIEGYINMAGLLILFAVMILVTCKDIAGLFAK